MIVNGCCSSENHRTIAGECFQAVELMTNLVPVSTITRGRWESKNFVLNLDGFGANYPLVICDIAIEHGH